MGSNQNPHQQQHQIHQHLQQQQQQQQHTQQPADSQQTHYASYYESLSHSCTADDDEYRHNYPYIISGHLFGQSQSLVATSQQVGQQQQAANLVAVAPFAQAHHQPQIQHLIRHQQHSSQQPHAHQYSQQQQQQQQQLQHHQHHQHHHNHSQQPQPFQLQVPVHQQQLHHHEQEQSQVQHHQHQQQPHDLQANHTRAHISPLRGNLSRAADSARASGAGSIDGSSPSRTPNPAGPTANPNQRRRTFACPVCAKEFTEKFNMRRHQQIHSDTRPKYVCNECSKSFAWKDNFVRHKRAAHRSQAVVSQAPGNANSTASPAKGLKLTN